MTRVPGERLFRALLRIYPPGFRHRYGEGMTEFYRDRRAALRPGPSARCRLWTRLLADGMCTAAAEWLRVAAGAVTGHHHRTHSSKDGLMSNLVQDLRLAVRGLLRTPGFTAIALVTLALGIGANAAIFSVLEPVLIRPLPYRHAERVRVLWNAGQVPGERTAVAVPEFFDYREQLRTFDQLAAVRPQVSTILGPEGEPDRLATYLVTPNLFELLGTGPALGRSFQEGDGIPDGERVVVLSHALWRRRFGGDPTVIGREINVGGLNRTVVGVMPAEVRFPDAPVGFLRERAELWIPSTYEQLRTDGRGNQIIAVVGRLAPGATDARAAADLATMGDRFRRQWPRRYGEPGSLKWRVEPVPLRTEMVGSVQLALAVLTAAVGLVLLIACINVTNLLLARGSLRRREVAVRIALGASRRRLLGLLLSESLVLALAGGALGSALAWAGTPLLVRLAGGNIPRLEQAGVSLPVLAFAFAVSLVAGVVVGALPALRQLRTDLRTAIGEGGRGQSDSVARRRFRSALVAAQVAMALVVLVAAGLLGRSFAELLEVDPGFAPDRAIALELTLPRTSYDRGATVADFYRRVRDELAIVPGIEAAGVVYPLPLSGEGWSGTFEIAGRLDDPRPHAEYAVAGPGYFEAMGIELVAGRAFGAEDGPDGPLVALIDDRAARAYWPGASPIGERISAGGGSDWRTVVGVVRHVYRDGRHKVGEGQLYLPVAQFPQRQMFVVARSSGADPVALAGPIRAAVQQLDPALPTTRLNTVASLADRALAAQRFNLLLIGLFAALALGLATVGLYGVMAYRVAQRTREIGIRIALGGRPADVRRMLLRESLGISAIGLGIGVVASLGVSRLLTGLLFGVRAIDPLTYGAVCGVLLLVAAAAAQGPASRAMRVDPTVTLKE
ncbi:MAG: ABC transporter permease [Gemmatimonadales bacterium]